MLAACGSAPQAKASDPTPTPPTIDLSGWTTSVHGVGPTATLKNGRLELSLPWSTHNNQQPNDLMVKVVAPCQLSGDFEITVHYTLKTWPLNNGAWIGIGVADTNVARVSFRFGTDAYATYLAKTITQVETKNMSGSVRLARAGATITGYYQDADGSWVQIATAAAPSGPVTYALQGWADASFGQRDVVATIDSLSVTGAKVGCS